MTVDALTDLLGTLRARDVRLHPDGDSLHYDAPEHAMTGDLLERLRTHKAGLLRRLAAHADEPPVESSGPATYFQRRMHAQHHAGRLPAGLNVAQRIELTGPLDVNALGRALTALTARQGTLRCRLVQYGEELVQEVLPVSPVPLPVTDLSTLPPGERGAVDDDWVRRTAGEPFDLAVAPFLRTALLRRGPQEWTFLLVVHHIVIDGWGLDVLLRDLTALYTAALRHPGDAPPTDEQASLPPLAVTYPDVGRWQRDHLSGPRVRELRAYWDEELADAPFDLPLPLDVPRPERHTNRGATVEFTVPPDLSAEVEALARRRDTTVFTVMLSAYGTLLCRLSGRPEVVVACNIANRIRLEHEPLVAPFTNNVPLRLRSGGDGDPVVPVDAAARAFFGAAAHQDHPLALLLEDRAARGRPADDRFPQAVVVMQNQAAPALDLPDVAGEVHDLTVDGMRSEVCLVLVPETDRIRGHLRYARDLFDAATAESWATAYVGLLREAVTEPRAPRATTGPPTT